MKFSDFPRLVSDTLEQLKKLWSTYNWASHLARFEDTNLVPKPILRCRYFALGALAVAMVTLSVLLLSLNLNVLDPSHGSFGYHGIDQIAHGIAEDWASAVPHVTLNSLSPSKQTVAVGVAAALSLLAYGLLVFLGVWRRSAKATRNQQLIFSSFIISLGLVRYSLVTIPVAILVWIARSRGFEPSSSLLSTFGVLLFTYATTGAWTQLANRRGQHLGTAVSRDDDMPLIYSSLAPIVISLALLLTVSWTGDGFTPSILLQTFDACGAPDKGTCALYIRPRDIDGTIFLDKVDIVMRVMIDENKDFVGPRSIAVATANFRIIDSPDEPFPVQVGAEAARGVIGYSEFHCPSHTRRKNGYVPKIHVISYTASAIPKTMSDAEPERRESIQVAFDSQGDVPLLFRNIAKECSLFP